MARSHTRPFMTRAAARALAATLATACLLTAGCRTPVCPGNVRELGCADFQPDAPVGFWVEDLYQFRVETGTFSIVTRWAVLASSEETLEVAYRGRYNGKEPWLLTLEKTSGRVLACTEGGDAVEVRPPKPTEPGIPPDTAVIEELTVPAGTFRAERQTWTSDQGTLERWLGVEGPAKDILLKQAQTGLTGAVLTVLDEKVLQIGSNQVPTIHAAYSSGSESWQVQDPLPFVGNMVRIRGGAVSREVTGFGWE